VNQWSFLHFKRSIYSCSRVQKCFSGFNFSAIKSGVWVRVLMSIVIFLFGIDVYTGYFFWQKGHFFVTLRVSYQQFSFSFNYIIVNSSLVRCNNKNCDNYTYTNVSHCKTKNINKIVFKKTWYVSARLSISSNLQCLHNLSCSFKCYSIHCMCQTIWMSLSARLVQCEPKGWDRGRWVDIYTQIMKTAWLCVG